MVAEPKSALVTADELLAMGSDAPYELRRGILLPVFPRYALAGIVAGNIAMELAAIVRANCLGVCGTAGGGFVLARDPDTVRAPAVWFVAKAHIPAGGIPEGFWPGAPDLAVEVLSPSDRFGPVLQKARDYLDAGTRLLWVIDPYGRTVAVFRPGTMPELLGEDAELDGGDVLPGFHVTLAGLFPEA